MSTPNEGKLIGPNFSRRLAKVLPWAEGQMGVDQILQPRTPQVFQPSRDAISMGGRIGITHTSGWNGVDAGLDDTATTLLYQPWSHDQVRLYNGTSWQMRTINYTDEQPTITTAGLSASTWYQVFLSWDDTLKQVVLSLDSVGESTVWLNGALVHYEDSKKRCVGFIYTNATPEFESTPENRFILNIDNRIPLPVDATVNTGTGLPVTDTISIVNPWDWQLYHTLSVNFHTLITTGASSAAITANMASEVDTDPVESWKLPTRVPETGTPHVDNTTTGLTLAYDNLLYSRGIDPTTSVFVEFGGGGANDAIISGSLHGVLIG